MGVRRGFGRAPRFACAALVLAGLVLAATPASQPSAQEQRTGSVLRISDPADASGPLDIASVKLRQHLRTLRFSLRTRGRWGLAKLKAQPPAEPHRDPSACLFLKRGHSTRRVCLPRSKSQGLGVAKVRRNGQLADTHRVRAVISRDGPSKASFEVGLNALGVKPGKYSVHIATDWKGKPCERPGHPLLGDRCADRAPGKGGERWRVESVRTVGCTARHPTLIRRGGSKTRKVALTFDDGPSTYTASVLRILKAHHVHSTFFEIGQNVSSYPDASRAIIAGGHELANHSLHHESYPGSASMRETSARIEAATGFKPCLFRPPGGAENSRVVGDAAAQGMSTILWDVDPQDWRRPGSGAIQSNVLANTRNGSIVLMHDGGGDRSQTVAALPKIITTLQKRGYQLVTVSKLLGYRTRFALGSVPRPRPGWSSRAPVEPPIGDLGR